RAACAVQCARHHHHAQDAHHLRFGDRFRCRSRPDHGNRGRIFRVVSDEPHFRDSYCRKSGGRHSSTQRCQVNMDLFDKLAPLPGLRHKLLNAGADPFGVCMDEIVSATEARAGDRQMLLAGTNNYLGLTFEPECIRRAQEAIATQGTGTTGSRIANGTYDLHQSLERDLADFLGVSSVLVYSTGYQANLGAIAGLAGPDDTILIDADCHASIYDGCRLSGATIIRFRHNSPADLEKRLERLGPGTNKLVIVEGLYSMFGDTAPLAEFAEVKQRHGAYLFVDEAHSVGVYG